MEKRINVKLCITGAIALIIFCGILALCNSDRVGKLHDQNILILCSADKMVVGGTEWEPDDVMVVEDIKAAIKSGKDVAQLKWQMRGQDYGPTTFPLMDSYIEDQVVAGVKTDYQKMYFIIPKPLAQRLNMLKKTGVNDALWKDPQGKPY